MGGQIVDASIVEAPKQRNTKDEKAAIKAGRIPQAWKDKPHKLRQKDRDARWTLKRGRVRIDEDGKEREGLLIPAFGYKNHVSIDRRHGIIRRMKVTDAAAHDGARLREGLIDPANTASDVWADTAYRSAANEEWLARHGKLGPRSLQEAERQADAGTHGPRQSCEVAHSGEGGACVRRAERAHGLVHPHHRAQTRRGHDHPGQHGLQHETLVLA